MRSLDEIEQGAQCTHKNTGLRYSVAEVGEDEVLLAAESQDLQDLVVPTDLFLNEFVLGERYHAGRARGRGRSRARRAAGPMPANAKTQASPTVTADRIMSGSSALLLPSPLCQDPWRATAIARTPSSCGRNAGRRAS